MSIDSTWLRCPNCSQNLSPVEVNVYGCAAGHRFDRAKHGYLTLLTPSAPRTIGDDREMLAARAALLDSGAFEPIAMALVEAVRSHLPDAHSGALRVADLGCGTGYYSAALARAFPDAEFLLADRSPHAVRASLRAHPDATGVVLDIWRPLPLRDACVDVALNVFAPRNHSEFARILRKQALLFVIVPTDEHLRELRIDGALLDIPTGKADRVVEQFSAAGFRARSATAVEYAMHANATIRALLAGMGPSAHHSAELVPAHDAVAERRVTVSVNILAFEHSPGVA